MGPIAQCIEQISIEIGTALESFGFDPKPKIISGDSFSREWRRDNLWKFNVVEIYYKRGSASGIDINLRVYLPCPEGSETGLDGSNLQWIIGKINKSYWFPNWFGKIRVKRCKRFGHHTARDIVKALSWFDRFDSPERCLDLLNNRGTHWGPARGKAYQHLAGYLEALIRKSTKTPEKRKGAGAAG